MSVEKLIVKMSTRTQHTGIKMKINTTFIETEYEELMGLGYSHTEAINSVAREWYMTAEEVSNIIMPFLKKMNDIDYTGDLGDII